MSVFLDSSYLIGLTDPSDPWHRAATNILEDVEERAEAHTHALALAEVVAAVGSRQGGRTARDVYEAIRDDTILHMPTLERLDEAMTFVTHYDGTLSLADALFLVLMRETGFNEIASFDADFDKPGIERLGKQA